VLRTRSRGDINRDDGLSHLNHLWNQLKKLGPKLRMPLKRQLNLKFRRYLKDTILKMKIPMHHACIIALEDRNT
jgi:hypothetical protein